MKGRSRAAAILLLFILALGGLEKTEAREHFHVRITVVLGGLTIGMAGLFFLVSYQGEADAVFGSASSALLNWGDGRFSWEMPELVLRSSPFPQGGAGGIEGYTCLFRLRFR
jgi:hypothetical protein